MDENKTEPDALTVAEPAPIERKRKAPKSAWKRGCPSPNPGGRPRDLHKVRELAAIHTVEALDTIAELMRTADKDSVKLAAAEAILDRAWGRPPASVSIDASVRDDRTKAAALMIAAKFPEAGVLLFGETRPTKSDLETEPAEPEPEDDAG